MAKKRFNEIFLFRHSAVDHLPFLQQKNTNQNLENKTSKIQFDEAWKKVEALEKNGAGNKIISLCDSILLSAQNEQSYQDVFKALAIKSKYISLIEEESNLKIIREFESQLETAQFPLNAILNSAIAELYQQLYQQNRWQYADRTATIEGYEGDIRTWTLQDFQNKTRAHYQASLIEADKLSEVPIKFIDKILIHYPNVPFKAKANLTEHLFDFLLGRAIDHYERQLISSSPILNPEETKRWFLGHADFANTSFDSMDSMSAMLQVASYYQKQSAQVNKEGKTKALNLLIKRWRFAHYQLQLNQSDSVYHQALLMAEKNQEGKSTARQIIQAARAQLYFHWGSKYQAQNLKSTQEYQWYLKKAHQICSTVSYTDTSAGAIELFNLKKEIEQDRMSFSLEAVYLPSQENLFQLTSKNLKTLHLEIRKWPRKVAHQNLRMEDQIEILKKAPIVESWSVDLQDRGDFQTRFIEMTLPNLELGNYALVTSPNEIHFKEEANFAFQSFQVSRIAALSRYSIEEEQQIFKIMHRKTGNDLDGVQAKLFILDNHQGSRQVIRPYESLNSDDNGLIKLPRDYDQRRYRVQYSLGEDTLLSAQNYFYRQGPQSSRKRKRSQLFTDRSIYRPGQTLHFKGIIWEEKDQPQKVLTNENLVLSLFDTHGKEVEKIKVTSNDFGSYSGRFILPKDGLKGSFRISDGISHAYFNVEEYKRPSFKIDFDSLQGELAFEKTLKIGGQVISYSGVPSSKASYRYTIVRKINYPYWPWYSSYFPPQSEKIIDRGEGICDGQGNFQLDFKAEKSKEKHHAHHFVYHYELKLLATDLAGETQENTSHFKIGSQPILIASGLKDYNQESDLQNLVLNAKNTMGVDLELKGLLQLRKLISPKHYEIPKIWHQSANPIISFEDYHKKFPHESYGFPSSLDQLEKGNVLVSSQIKCNAPIDLFNSLEPGAYQIQFTAEYDGKPIVWNKRFHLLNSKSKKLSYPFFALLKVFNQKIEPGENLELLLSSKVNSFPFRIEVMQRNNIIHKSKVRLNGSQALFEFPILEEHRGGLRVDVYGMHENRLIQESFNIEVPFSNKDLDVKVESYRKLMEPGSEENWTIKVRSPKGNQKSEVLASMYDQSLDAFKPQHWNFKLFHQYRHGSTWQKDQLFRTISSKNWDQRERIPMKVFQRKSVRLNWFGFSLGHRFHHRRQPMMMADGVGLKSESSQEVFGNMASADNSQGKELSSKDKAPSPQLNQVPTRSNFKETVFFYPDLLTDQEGNAQVKFTMSEALSNWKLMVLAHQKDLSAGLKSIQVQTRKSLMVKANSPRFMREDDEINFSCLLQNQQEKISSGMVSLSFFDVLTGKKLDLFVNVKEVQNFSILPKEQNKLSWKIKIPSHISAIKYVLKASDGTFSDGEENVLPILPKSILVRESQSFSVRGGEEKTVVFQSLKNSLPGTAHELFQVELCPNPIWFAVQSLPYLKANRHENTEALFSRYFTNRMVQKIIKDQPKIKEVFAQWKNGKQEIKSKFNMNDDLKSILMNETPWLNTAENEQAQLEQIAALFESNNSNHEIDLAWQKLKQAQHSSGAWPWINGMRDNRYISQYIIAGLGRIQKVFLEEVDHEVIEKGLNYLDQEMHKDLERLKRNKVDLDKYVPNSLQVHYLYTRSLFSAFQLKENNTAFTYFFKQATKHWTQYGLMEKAMLALAHQEFKPQDGLAKSIIASLKDHALQDEELGMYWKQNTGGAYWAQSKIEVQSFLIEAFAKIDKDAAVIDELKTWLIRQKQSHHWSNSKATVQACFALLENGSNWLNQNQQVQIQVGDELLNQAALEPIPGLAYIKKNYERSKIESDLAKITLVNEGNQLAWGASYWHYFSSIDSVKANSNGPLKLEKSFYHVRFQGNKKVLVPLSNLDLKKGDELVVRLKISSDRDMEFLHLKELRAACSEPTKTLSAYHYQDGLSYYESHLDYASNFYFDRLQRGTHVLEYSFTIEQTGNFAAGPASIQCLYAPEFSAHSGGESFKIGDN